MRVEEIEFAQDSPLEGNGFELTVPREIGSGFDEDQISWLASRCSSEGESGHPAHSVNQPKPTHNAVERASPE
jgi:hypothetical protein